MSSFTFWEAIAAHAVGWGNGYAEIEYNNAGRPTALWPLLPDRTWAERVKGRKVYKTRIGDEVVVLSADRVLHIPGLGYNGLTGYNPITLHRQSLGLALAAEEFGARYFGNGSRAAGVLTQAEGAKGLTPEAHQRLKESWHRAHTGLSNAHRAVILEAGMDWKQISIPPEEAQFIETRKHQIAEVARIFRVPLAMLEEHDKAATYASVEQFMLSFVNHTVRPWLVRIEKAVNLSLISREEQGRYFAEFLIDGLLRGDVGARGQFYKEMWNLGAFSINDILELENRNPVEGGEQRFVPLNVVPLDKAGEFLASDDEPPPADEEEDRSAPPAVEARAIDLAEKRAERSVTARRRIEAIFRDRLEEVGDVIFRKEANAGLRAVDKAFKDRTVSDFEAWVDEFYGTHPEYATERSFRTIRAMAVAIQAEVADELGGVPDYTPEIEEFVRRYCKSLGEREAAYSVSQLRRILSTTPPDQLEAALRARFEEWKEKRKATFAKQNAIRAQNALAREAYIRSGISRIRWVTVGENCPLCSSMNGRTVSITGAFLRKGETINPGVEGVAPLTTKRLIRHPPLHKGCDCTISAAQETQ